MAIFGLLSLQSVYGSLGNNLTITFDRFSKGNCANKRYLVVQKVSLSDPAVSKANFRSQQATFGPLLTCAGPGGAQGTLRGPRGPRGSRVGDGVHEKLALSFLIGLRRLFSSDSTLIGDRGRLSHRPPRLARVCQIEINCQVCQKIPLTIIV